MLKILFVCHGNICRSPMAEFVFKKMACDAGLSDKLYIASAATSTEEIGNDIYPPAKREMDKQGIPYERRGARQIRRSDFEEFDLIIGMDSANIRNLMRIAGDGVDAQGLSYASKVRLMMDYAGKAKDVADPWYTGDFSTSYRDILEGCEGLLESCKELK